MSQSMCTAPGNLVSKRCCLLRHNENRGGDEMSPYRKQGPPGTAHEKPKAKRPGWNSLWVRRVRSNAVEYAFGATTLIFLVSAAVVACVGAYMMRPEDEDVQGETMNIDVAEAIWCAAFGAHFQWCEDAKRATRMADKAVEAARVDVQMRRLGERQDKPTGEVGGKQ